VHERERVSLLELALILVIVVAATAFGVVCLGGVFTAIGGAIPTSIGGSIGR
jgi:hypothetical protein